MKINLFYVIIAIAAILALLIGAVYIVNLSTIMDKTPAIEKRLTGLFTKFSLSDKNLIKKYLEIKKLGIRRYIHMHREYDVPKAFALTEFNKALKKSLGWSAFKVAGSDQVISKKVEIYTITVNRGRFDILTLRLNKRRPPLLPSIAKKVKNPKVAIVMDDLGYNVDYMDEIFSIKEPIIFSILPNLQFSKTIARVAHENGYETILHLPLEAHKKDAPEEANTLKTWMDERQVITILDSDIDSIPYLKGVSNHQGSKGTEDAALMAVILGAMKRKGLYFFDSLTGKSVCREVAAKVGLSYAARDIFLDNSNNIPEIEKQLLALRWLAFKKGRAIAICHYRKNTIAALKKMMPEMASEGIQFVRLSEMVK